MQFWGVDDSMKKEDLKLDLELNKEALALSLEFIYSKGHH